MRLNPESVPNRVHPETGDLVGVYFHAHRNHDGCWVDASHIQLTPEGRPIAYVALHGHGTYPVSGKARPWLLRFLSPRCSNLKPRLQPVRQ